MLNFILLFLDEFNKALAIMNRAASGPWVPNARDYMPQTPAATTTRDAFAIKKQVHEEQQALQVRHSCPVCHYVTQILIVAINS